MVVQINFIGRKAYALGVFSPKEVDATGIYKSYFSSFKVK